MKLFFLVMIVQRLWASPTCAWHAKVTYPDKEIKLYEVRDGTQDLPIAKSKWKCKLKLETTTKDEDGDSATIGKADLTCERGDAKIMLPTVCMKATKYPSTLELGAISSYIELFDGPKLYKVEINSK